MLALCLDKKKGKLCSVLTRTSYSSSFLPSSLPQQIAAPQKPHFALSLAVCIPGMEPSASCSRYQLTRHFALIRSKGDLKTKVAGNDGREAEEVSAAPFDREEGGRGCFARCGAGSSTMKPTEERERGILSHGARAPAPRIHLPSREDCREREISPPRKVLRVR